MIKMIPKIALISLLIAISVLLYFNSLDCGFVFDDTTAIRDNKDLRPQATISDLFKNDFWGTPIQQERSHKSYRPLTVLTFRWNYALGELNPSGYHAINVMLHAVVVVLFFQLCYHFLDIMHSFLCAILFAVHPIHTEAVTGVVGRAELLSSIFFLICLLLYLNVVKRYSSNSKILDLAYITILLILVVVGTLCKEQCITVLGVCIGLEGFYALRDICEENCRLNLAKLSTDSNSSNHHEVSSNNVDQSEQKIKQNQSPSSIWKIIGWWRCSRVLLLLIGGISLSYFRIKINGKYMPYFTDFDNPAAHSPFPTRHLTFNYLIYVNLYLLFLPSELCCDWTMGTLPLIKSLTDYRNIHTIMTYLFMVIIGIVCLKRIRCKTTETFVLGMLILVMSFLPASNMLIAVGFVIAERVLYTPSIGFCLLIGVCLQKASKKLVKYEKLIYGIFIFILLIHGVKTYLRNFDWRSENSLFMSALKVNKNNAKIWNNVGHSLENEKRFKDALQYFIVASKTQPNDVGSHINVGRTLVNLERLAEAEEAFKVALAYMPKPRKGRTYTTRVSPKDLNIFINLSNLLIKNRSRLLEADAYLKRAISMRPDFVDAYQNRGDILIKLGRPEEARQQYITAIQFKPNSADLHYNLGVVNVEMKRTNEALQCFQTALRLEPRHKPARLSLASFYSENFYKRDEAKKIYYELIDEEFELEKCNFALAMMETDDKNFQLAEKHYKSSLNHDPKSRGSLFNLALLYNNELKKYDESVDLLHRLLKEYPTHVKGHLLLGDILLNHRKNLNEAYHSFWRASSLDPHNAQAKHNLCVVMVEQGQLEKAEQCLIQASSLAPNEAYIKQHLAIVKSRLASTSGDNKTRRP